MRSDYLLRFTLALFASVVFGQSPLLAQTPTTLFVANNSVYNGTGCGARDRPCRTISQAVRNASDADLIEVGPGIYGGIPLGGEGTIAIDKSVEIYSTGGAALTIIKASQGSFDNRIVRIDVSGVTFGRPNGGFTLAGSKAESGFGTQALDVSGDASDVTIAGNIAVGNEWGILTSGNQLRVEGNAAFDDARTGFQIIGTGNVVIDNVASGNSTGFFIGFADVTFTNNAAIGNDVGIEVDTEFSNELSGNSVIGNGRTGFWFRQPPQVGARLAIHRNNIYGNGDAADGCGVLNESGNSVDATNNYWGKANGPGPNPGDRAHGTCLVRGSISTTPFATVPFPIGDPSAQ
jgi:hypothetical protein